MNILAIAKAKEHCAGVYRALNLNPGTWRENVLTGSFTAQVSTVSSRYYLHSYVGNGGEYDVTLRDKRDNVLATLSAGSYADYSGDSKNASACASEAGVVVLPDNDRVPTQIDLGKLLIRERITLPQAGPVGSRTEGMFREITFLIDGFLPNPDLDVVEISDWKHLAVAESGQGKSESAPRLSSDEPRSPLAIYAGSNEAAAQLAVFPVYVANCLGRPDVTPRDILTLLEEAAFLSHRLREEDAPYTSRNGKVLEVGDVVFLASSTDFPMTVESLHSDGGVGCCFFPPPGNGCTGSSCVRLNFEPKTLIKA